MIRRSIIIGGILMMIYIKDNMTQWSLSPNPDSIISQYFINMISIIPLTIILMLYYLFIVFGIISLFRRTNYYIKVIIYIVSGIALSLGLHITIDLLSFEDYTNTILMRIYHPIPLEAKQYYLLTQLELLIKQNYPDMYVYPEKFEWIAKKIQIQLETINWTEFRTKSPSQISQYACDLINVSYKDAPYYLHTAILAVIIWVILESIHTRFGL